MNSSNPPKNFYGDWVFSAAAPRLLNVSPINLELTSLVSVFREKIKDAFFQSYLWLTVQL